MRKAKVRSVSLLFSAAVAVGLLVFGCSSGNGTTCTRNQAPQPAAGTQGSQAPAANQCIVAGGQCMTANAGTYTCPAGMHLAPSGTPADNACGYASYGNDPAGTNPCNGTTNYYAGDRAGFASPKIPCCLPGDAGTDDASSDASDEADAPSSIGSCQGQVCGAGCSCGIFPTTGQPTCFCSDAGAPDGGRDAQAPNCGTIYCFNGCVCADFGKSACACN
jgi:hypothetical protein